MAFLGDFGKIFLGGASTGDVVGAATAAVTGNPYAASVAGNLAQTAADDLGARGQMGETTQTQTVQSSMGGLGYGPAQNVEIDFSGRPDMGGFMPATFTPNPNFGPILQDPMVQQANVLKFAPAVGGAVVGFAADFITDLLTGEQKKMIITRKLKRETEDLMEYFMNDMRQVALQLSKLKGKQYTEENVLKILLHKFTNQGPYVTKAAVRKTRKTIRKLDTLKNLHAQICGRPTPARRRTTRRTMAGTSKAIQIT